MHAILAAPLRASLGAVLAVKKLVEFAKGIKESKMVVRCRLRDTLGGAEGLGFDRAEIEF